MLVRPFIILDFGSQFTQLIARRLRELGFYSEIHSYKYPTEEIKKKNPYGIILSGGPNSVYEEGSPQRDVQELRNISPLLGVCYGMQLLTHALGGKVAKSTYREYGLNYVTWTSVVGDVPARQKVWMSHGDVVESVPPGFQMIGMSDGGHPAAMRGDGVLALQFHPEVAHTEHGTDLLKYFAKEMCHAAAEWDAPHMLSMLQDEIRKKVGATDHVLVGLSGGVDSTVVATLLTKTLGAERVHCVFVDNGLLRKNEYESVLQNYHKIGLNVKGVDAKKEFMTELAGKEDPEAKRKTIGRVFIEIFEKSYDHSSNIKWLAQGTLYPDVIESVSSIGGSVTIKSHHNVGGLPEKMKLGLVEPVRELFKDEVRLLGAQLGLPHDMLWRHPFPGPGLAIRVIGEVTEEKLTLMKEADDVFISYLKEKGLYDKIWQAFCVLLPIKSVGVMGDGRTYDRVLALRAVTSQDGMTADWYPFEFQQLREISNRITNKVKGINRVVYDVTSKPPGTIEWE
jgi:GMP synthase (glutamine-hydrolyzing), C-terminal domain or B subunit/GMP synthase (glutamine-hydrolyzing), N-terminal domain or A subunit